MVTAIVKDLAEEALKVYQDGDYLNAARLFSEAASSFQTQGNFLDAAEMKNNESVALMLNGDARGSYDAAQGTAQVFLDAGDFRRQGLALGNEAVALTSLHKIDDAIQSYHLSADALEKAGEDQLRASVFEAVAGLHLRRGKIMEALLSMRQGLAGVKNPTFKQKILLALLKIRS